MLHRLLQRAFLPNCTAFCSAVKVGLGHLHVVLDGDALGIADPLTDDVQRVVGGQFGFPGGAEVVEEPWPRLAPSPPDDPHELRAQVLVRRAVPGDDMHGALGGLLERLFEVRPQLGEDRHPALRLALVLLGLRARDAEAVQFPVDVSPLQGLVLGGAAESAVARQGEDQPPLQVGAGVEDALARLAVHEELAGLVAHAGRLHVLERVFDDQFLAEGGAEELPAPLHRLAHGCCGVAFLQPDDPVVAIPCCDRSEIPGRSEVGDQSVRADAKVRRGPLLHVRAPGDIGGEELSQSSAGDLLAGWDESHCGQFIGEVGAKSGNPAGGLGIPGNASDFRDVQRLDLPANFFRDALGDLAQPDRPPLAVGGNELD
ncbi:MAG TPA: hypothetical protein VEL76_21530 [Gemmataceae bacterium]|nr:hypothetical protein [Gemmataceae bacterium]